MSTYTQENRRLAIETPLGKDVLLLTSFVGAESISKIFSFELDLVSLNDSITPKDIVGKNVSFFHEQLDGKPRYFNGFVRRFAFLGSDDRLSRYSAEVVPWLWFLTRHSDCRIFQSKSVPQIIEQVFKDRGATDFKLEIQSSPPTREYCVQYRETDFDFVSRLMEEEGIFYYFLHEKGKHTMVLANHKGAYKDCVEKEVEFRANLNAPELTDMITGWEHQYEFRSGKYAHTDYNFETPTAPLLTQSSTVVKLDGIDKLELFDFPGKYPKKGEGEAYVKVRMEEEETPYDVVSGSSKCRTFFAGGKFKITKHHSKSEEGKSYVITSVQHSASESVFAPGGSSAPAEYNNHFTCIPDSATFRPARRTPKSVVHGSQTAVVVGPAGEEIYTDKYGRVKVHFFWDRHDKSDQNSSCWIRVAQLWAGKQWGAMYIPRIGQEVVVDFLEGDPDRPLITGRVYHAESMPPYDLPANMTQSGVKSRSTKGGDGSNFNEFRFEDKKGSEQLFMHAEKNQDLEVENDETHWVGHDRTKTIDNDETTHVKHDRTETVDNDETITIHGNRTEEVDKDETITIHQNRTETVDKDETITIGGNRTESVSKDESITISGGRTESVSKDESVSVEGERSHTVGKGDTLSVGKVLTVTAGDEITIKTGSASINMKKNGDITISGKTITIKASSDVVIKGQKILQN